MTPDIGPVESGIPLPEPATAKPRKPQPERATKYPFGVMGVGDSVLVARHVWPIVRTALRNYAVRSPGWAFVFAAEQPDAVRFWRSA